MTFKDFYRLKKKKLIRFDGYHVYISATKGKINKIIYSEMLKEIPTNEFLKSKAKDFEGYKVVCNIQPIIAIKEIIISL